MRERWWHVVNILHAACVLHFLDAAENSYLAERQAERSICKTFIFRGFCSPRPRAEQHNDPRHRSISSTMVYVGTTDAQAAEALQAALMGVF